MTGNKGGRMVPDDFMDSLIAYMSEANPMMVRRSAPYPPPTFRQRLRARWWDMKWAIHDALFPSCRSEDDD